MVIKIVESLIAKHKKVEPWLESMYNLAKKDFQNTKPPKKKSPGKQAKNHYANARKDKSTGKVPKKCRKCQHGEYVPVGQQATNLIAEINRTKERLEPFNLSYYIENGDTRSLANFQVLQSKLNHPSQQLSLKRFHKQTFRSHSHEGC